MDQTKERCYGRTRQGAATPAKFWSQSRDKSRGRTTKHQSGVNKRRREESRAIAVPARESWRPSSAPRDPALAHRSLRTHSGTPLKHTQNKTNLLYLSSFIEQTTHPRDSPIMITAGPRLGADALVYEELKPDRFDPRVSPAGLPLACRSARPRARPPRAAPQPRTRRRAPQSACQSGESRRHTPSRPLRTP
jgi:hypothetical protein